MDIKSRYEVIADLEAQKRDLISKRDSFDERLQLYEREIKDLKRLLEDKEEDAQNFKDSVKQKTETIGELIKSVDDSLKRFSQMNGKK